jgi:16S rRNA (cytidine1402-2'-O)-methyltransferase
MAESRRQGPIPTSEHGAKPAALAPGLYLVATPIGSARDITLRALDILASADVIAAEDTRSMRHLLEIHGIALGGRPLWAYHDHNGARMRPRILSALAEGKSVAYAAEAGTPMVADPGYQLARAATASGHPVTAAPGPSAMLAALSLSGLPSDRFLFAGFPPPQPGARDTWAAELRDVDATVIVYESPKRIQKLLAALCEIWDPTRPAALCRELTKRFEEVRRGSLAELHDSVMADPPRGEIVLVIDRAGRRAPAPEELEAALRRAMETMRIKDASTTVAEAFGLPRREIYQMALALKSEE